jgi:hypothetical protein
LFDVPPRIGLAPGMRSAVHSRTLPDMSKMRVAAVPQFALHAARVPVAMMSS